MAITGGTCAYDAQNRLIRATSGTNTVSFAYDGLNRAVTRTVNGAATHLIYDRDWNIIEEYDNAGTQLAAMAYGAAIDEPIFRWASGYILSYYHQDVLGNVTTLTDTSGVPVESYRYDVYGKPTIYDPFLSVRSASFFGNSYMFTGREYFAEAGLYLYRNRAYSPESGRFLQRDPIGFGGGDANLYRYVSNNPINRRDPLGLLDVAGVHVNAGEAYGSAALDFYVGVILNENSSIAEKGGAYVGAFFSALWIEDTSNATAKTLLSGLGVGFAASLLDDTGGHCPPIDQPKPPGWNEDWDWRPGDHRKDDGWRWVDPDGGEWRYHEDQRHTPHWDYNPNRNWTDGWQNVDQNGQQAFPFGNSKN